MINKLREMNNAVDAAQEQNEKDIQALPEGRTRNERKYLAMMFAEIKQIMVHYEDITIDIEEPEERAA